MSCLKPVSEWFKDAKGVATSLIEATATVAVGAVLAGVAIGGAIDAINDSKIQAAIGDVGSIGQGVITFYKDNAFFPLFKDGSKTGYSGQMRDEKFVICAPGFDDALRIIALSKQTREA